MIKYFDIRNYVQRYNTETKEATCTCLWGTMEISRYPKDASKRRPCKHIKEILKIESLKK